MSKWLDRARSDGAVPCANSAKTAERPSFGTNGTFGTSTEDERTAFEERAGIVEYDGGLPRSHAELVALACVAPLGPGETLETRDATIINLAAHFDRLRTARGSK